MQCWWWDNACRSCTQFWGTALNAAPQKCSAEQALSAWAVQQESRTQGQLGSAEATSSPELCRQLDLWFPAAEQILWSFWPLLEDFLRMLKGKIGCITRDFLGQQALHVSQEAALPCLLLLISLSRSVRGLRLHRSMLVFCGGFFLKAILHIQWNFPSSKKWRVKSRLIYPEL